jgi:hypothetical protein
VELSKTVALTAILFIVVLILTSGISLGAERKRDPLAKRSEATFERNGPKQIRPAGTEHAPQKGAGRERPQQAAAACQYKPVMTEADMRACRRK